MLMIGSTRNDEPRLFDELSGDSLTIGLLNGELYGLGNHFAEGLCNEAMKRTFQSKGYMHITYPRAMYR